MVVIAVVIVAVVDVRGVPSKQNGKRVLFLHSRVALWNVAQESMAIDPSSDSLWIYKFLLALGYTSCAARGHAENSPNHFKNCKHSYLQHFRASHAISDDAAVYSVSEFSVQPLFSEKSCAYMQQNRERHLGCTHTNLNKQLNQNAATYTRNANGTLISNNNRFAGV